MNVFLPASITLAIAALAWAAGRPPRSRGDA